MSTLQDIAKETIIANVRHMLDEQELIQDAQMVEDALPIDGRIEALYASAYDYVQNLLSWRYVSAEDVRVKVGEDFVWDLQKGTGRIRVPDGFLRLGSLRMRRWKKAVHDIIAESSSQYALQYSYATRGGEVNPVVALVDGGKWLEYFSIRRGENSHVIEEYSVVYHSRGIGNDKSTKEAYDILVLVLSRDVALSMGRDISAINNLIKERLVTMGENID